MIKCSYNNYENPGTYQITIVPKLEDNASIKPGWFAKFGCGNRDESL